MSADVTPTADDDSLTTHLERALANADDEAARYHIRSALQYWLLAEYRGADDCQ